MPRTNPMGALAVAIACLLATLGAPGATGVAAASEPAPLDRLYAELGIDRVATDYVFVVDVSSSMHSAEFGNLYAKARSYVHETLANLRADDRVTLITFAEQAAVVWTDRARRMPGAVTSELPMYATEGNRTDIGEALERAVRTLESWGRDRRPTVATVVLITGSKHRPVGGAYPYTDRDTTSWKALRSDVRQLRDTALVPFYLSFGPEAEGDLMESVFEEAEPLPEDVEEAVGRTVKETREMKARTALGSDHVQPVEVRWPPRGPVRPGDNKRFVTFVSHTSRLPLRLTGLSVTSPSPDLTSTLSVDTLELRPGESRTVSVRLHWDAGGQTAGPYRWSRLDEQLTVSGTVGSDHRETIERAFDLRTDWRLEGGTGTARGSAQLGQPLPWLLMLGTPLLALLCYLGLRSRGPRLRGEVSAHQPGRGDLGYGRVYLRGHRMKVPSYRERVNASAIGPLPGRAIIKGLRRSGLRSGIGALVIEFWPISDRDRAVTRTCEDQSSVIINGVEFWWRSDVRRPSRRANPGGGGARNDR